MKTFNLEIETSIHAQGKSFDVVSSIQHGEFVAMELFNVPSIKSNKMGIVEVDDVKYILMESYFDSGSDDYYYFAIAI